MSPAGGAGRYRVWPEGRKDEMVDLTIAEYFARTGRAGYGWEVASVYYRDYPVSAGTTQPPELREIPPDSLIPS